MTAPDHRRFNPLERPDRYDDRLDTERHSEAASRAACGVESVYPPGYHKPTGAEIRAEIEAHERDMQIGLAWMRSHEHLRLNPEAFRRYILSPKYVHDRRNFVEGYNRVHKAS